MPAGLFQSFLSKQFKSYPLQPLAALVWLHVHLVTPQSHLRWLWTQNQLYHFNFYLRREKWKKLIGEWSVMDCYRQPTTCTCQAAAGQRKLELRQKVYAFASKEKYLGTLLFKGKIRLFFEAHSCRFQVGNSWPSFLASKHDYLPCQPRTKSCHSCEEFTCSLSASTNKWLIYHSSTAISPSC